MAGCVELSMAPANSDKISGMSASASRLAGKFLVSRDKNTCCSLAVSHFKKATALSLLGEALFTTKEEPAPPQIFNGNLLLMAGGSMTPYSKFGFISL